jgi:(1->4)-alpha-D-glucan 1-alpha-D-glucosylmutase
LTFNSLRRALQQIIACFPVYRSYITSDAIHPDDRRYVHQAVSQAQRRNPTVSRELFAFVLDMLLLQYQASASADEQAEQRRFVGKFQQVTAPVMAKGLEDTALYRYNRLLSLNEVGGDADRARRARQGARVFAPSRRTRTADCTTNPAPAGWPRIIRV